MRCACDIGCRFESEATGALNGIAAQQRRGIFLQRSGEALECGVAELCSSLPHSSGRSRPLSAKRMIVRSLVDATLHPAIKRGTRGLQQTIDRTEFRWLVD